MGNKPKTYDYLRLMRLLRLFRRDCWDEDDWDEVNNCLSRLPCSPYQLREDGVYPVLYDAPKGLTPAERAALHPKNSPASFAPVLALPATLPAIVQFLDASGEYARLPGDMWPRLLKRVERMAAPVKEADTGVSVALNGEAKQLAIPERKAPQKPSQERRTGLKPTVQDRSIGSGDMVEIFSGLMLTTQGGIATEEQLKQTFSNCRDHQAVHVAAKLCYGEKPTTGQRSAPARWDPVLFANHEKDRGHVADPRKLDVLFANHPALADRRKIWKDQNNFPLRKPSGPH